MSCKHGCFVSFGHTHLWLLCRYILGTDLYRACKWSLCPSSMPRVYRTALGGGPVCEYIRFCDSSHNATCLFSVKFGDWTQILRFVRQTLHWLSCLPSPRTAQHFQTDRICLQSVVSILLRSLKRVTHLLLSPHHPVWASIIPSRKERGHSEMLRFSIKMKAC